MASLTRSLWLLFKMRIGFAIMLCALAGVAVSPGSALSAWQIIVLALAILLSSASAGAFNHYVERDLDARMARTRNRPFVTGQFTPGVGWLLIIVGILAAAVIMAAWALNWSAAVYLFLGAFVYGVVYTVWLKNRTWLNIVLGGLAGSFAVLAGAAAVDPALSAAPIILAAVLFLWTPPHFWSLATVLHKDYAAAGVPMLPVVVGDRMAARVIFAHTAALVALSLVAGFFGLGWIYLFGAAVGGSYFLWKSWQLVQAPGPRAAAANFKASLVQLSLLLLCAIADRALIG